MVPLVPKGGSIYRWKAHGKNFSEMASFSKLGQPVRKLGQSKEFRSFFDILAKMLNKSEEKVC